MRLLHSCLIAGLLTAPVAVAETPGQIQVSPAQAREYGLEAIRLGRPDIAARIASDLLEIDAKDSFAHFLMANSLMRFGQKPLAEDAAKEAYRFAQTPEQRFQSARLVADLAFQRGALTTSQWWLRQSAEAAPDEARQAKAIKLFQAVKARNPWRVALAFSLRPSDNVNNGSSGQYNIIDGLPYVGYLSQDAQAVKGIIADASVKLSYRIKQSATYATMLGLDLSKRKVSLGSAEKARLGGDPGFGSGRIALSLRQDWRPENSKHLFSFEGSYGRQTYQSGSDYNFVGLGFGHRLAISPRTGIDSALDIEKRSGRDGRRGDRSFSIRSTLIHQRDNQDLITATALASRFTTDIEGRSSRMVGVQLGYSLAKPLGPVGVSATLGLYETRYEGYTLAGITVPGGRSDRTGYGELQLKFDDLSYAGFAPVLRLRHQRTASNVSRFDAKETSVVLGLASKF